MTRPTLSPYSRFGQRVRRRFESELPLLPPGLPNPSSMTQALEALKALGADTASALRTTRQLVIERLLYLDCDAHAPLQHITQAMTDLAEFALKHACTEVQHRLDQGHGMPTTTQGTRVPLWVIGMGKLGARELNVSSDIDLIYIYEQDGETLGDTQGRGRISNQEYFAKAVRAIYALIGDTTEHGFVFRVDLALRPNGNSGPPAVSLGALEEYLHVQGREWERFAWLKSRVVATLGGTDGAATPHHLRSVVIPFVFRRYLDYNVFDALRILHRQIRDHAIKRSTGHPERANDVKLSRGGIREIEFTVQLLQVVRGGQYPELRTRPTLSALPRLVKAGLMSQATSKALAQAYEFLRRVEHRIQYLDDQQTHVLPQQDPDLDWIAATMGMDSTHQFLYQLDSHRETVAQEFNALLGGGANNCKGCKAVPKALDFDALLEQLPEKFRARIALWRKHPRVMALRDESRARLLRLIARTALWVNESKVTEEAAVRLSDWIEPLLRRESCSWSAPMCTSAYCACWGQPAGQHATCCCTRASLTSSPAPTCSMSALAPPTLNTNSIIGAPHSQAPAKTTMKCCSTCCAAHTTLKYSAPWPATWKAG
jgi:[glutamine synthetase] adenylyltransferase / [glutamine synthetase]-adenylyl-L-tyrosine phosphorylase